MRFSRPRLVLDGRPSSSERNKALALLVYLAVTGQNHSRQALETLFWPDYDESRAYAYLRRTLFTLNAALGEGWVEAGRENLFNQPHGDLWLDVAQFQRGPASRSASRPPARRGIPGLPCPAGGSCPVVPGRFPLRV